MIKTPDRQRLEIRGSARHADDCDGLVGDLTTGSSFTTPRCAMGASGGESQTPGRLAFAAIYKVF